MRTRSRSPEYLRARAATRPEPEVYIRAKRFTDEVKKSSFLTYDEKVALCVKAWNGDLKGARNDYAQLVCGKGGRW